MGKIIYLPVATLPEDPLKGCSLWCDRERVGTWGASSTTPSARSPFPVATGKAWAGAGLVGAAYIAACVIWPAALWALPVCVTAAVALYGRVML